MVNGVLKQTMKKTTTRLNLLLHTTWDGRRDHLGGDMTPPVDIGARSKGIIGMVLYSKACWKCDDADKRGEEAEGHECPNNFEGSSKSMEASVILKMVENAFLNCFFVIDIIVSDNDRTMRAVLKHPSKGARGQVLKSSKGKFHEDIPEPSFLADSSHRVKVVAKHIFSIVNKIRDLRCGCTKADALWLKKGWEYMIKKNREKHLKS